MIWAARSTVTPARKNPRLARTRAFCRIRASRASSLSRRSAARSGSSAAAARTRSKIGDTSGDTSAERAPQFRTITRGSASCAPEGAAMTSTNEDPMTAVERLVGVTNAHDIDGAVSCFADDYVLDAPVHPQRSFRGNEQVRRNWTQIFGAVPDIAVRVLRSACDGNAAWTEWEMTGTRRDRTAARAVPVTGDYGEDRREPPGGDRRVLMADPRAGGSGR